MPRIPTYDVPQAEARALPGVRQSSSASPALLGADAAQQVATAGAMMDTGTALNGIAIKMQERENADMLFRAETALKDEYLNFEEGVRQRKGQDAWGATRDAEKWFADQEKKHSEGLTNDVQRALFRQSITKLRQSAVNTVSRYESGERHRSLEESANASIVGSINLAAANAGSFTGPPPINADGTPGASPMLGIKTDILKRVQALASLNGWSPERKQFEEAKHLTNLHKQVIQSLVDRSPSKAREYFEANKAEINGSEYDVVDRTLKVGETKQAAFEFAERPDIMALATESDRIAAARDHFKDEPEKREAAIHEIKTRAAEVTQARERAQRDAADAAWAVYGRTGNLNDVPASTLAALDGHTYATMKEHAANKAAGKGTVTDFATYYDLRQMAVSDPAGFRRVDLRGYINKLSPSDLQEMAKLQTADPDKIKEAATLSQQLGVAHNQLKWGSSDREKKGAFDRAVTDAINAEQKQRGKALNYEERQAVIDRLLIEGDVNGWLPGGKRSAFEVQGTPAAADFVPKITDADRDAIKARFLARNGRAPTDDEIVKTFKIWKGL